MTSGLGAVLKDLPLIAILRGLRPEEAKDAGDVLAGRGFRVIEVPLNSPDPFTSIATIAANVDTDVIVGAGTVLRVEDVARIADAGGRIVVMPHADMAVIREAKRRGLYCTPGVATPTEAFAALDAGADALKLFPAEAMPPAVIRAMLAVLPREVWLLPVGGITPTNMRPYLDAGVRGFGLGSALYKAGMAIPTLAANADAFVAAWAAIRQEAAAS